MGRNSTDRPSRLVEWNESRLGSWPGPPNRNSVQWARGGVPCRSKTTGQWGRRWAGPGALAALALGLLSHGSWGPGKSTYTFTDPVDGTFAVRTIW